jgi:hypothetical protein
MQVISTMCRIFGTESTPTRFASSILHEGRVMTKASSSSSIGNARYGELLRAVEGLRNWRAVGLSIIFLGAALSLAILGGMLGLPRLFAFLALLVIYCGMSATGLSLMDQARNLPPRALIPTIVESVPAALRIFAMALIAFAGVLLLYMLMAIILLIYKIPGLGPALYAVALPVLVVVSGFLLFGVAATFSMICPAIWSGASLRGAVAMLWQIATRRTVELLVNLILLYLLSLLVGGIVFGGILGAGFFSVGLISYGILNTGGLAHPMDTLSGMGASSYAVSTAFGVSILLVLVFSALNAMVLLGLNRIYLKLSVGLAPSATKRLIGQRLAEAQDKAQAETVATQAATAPTASVQEPVASLCPQCHAPVTPGDIFCGACGGKLG